MKTLNDPTYSKIITELKTNNVKIKNKTYLFKEVIKKLMDNKNIKIISSDNFLIIYNINTKYYIYHKNSQLKDSINNIFVKNSSLLIKEIKLLEKEASELTLIKSNAIHEAESNIIHLFKQINDTRQQIKDIKNHSTKIKNNKNIIKKENMSLYYYKNNISITITNNTNTLEIIVQKDNITIFPFYNQYLNMYLTALSTKNITTLIEIVINLIKEGNYD